MTGWYIFGWLFIATLVVLAIGECVIDRIGDEPRA